MRDGRGERRTCLGMAKINFECLNGAKLDDWWLGMNTDD